MNRLVELAYRMRALLRRRRLERDLDDELAFHLAMKAADYERAGVTDARDAARRRFGNVTRVREEVRDMWTFPSAESVWADVRMAVRRLVQDRAFSVIAVTALALGIATNSTFFALVHAICLRGLPIDAPERVVVVGSRDGSGRPGGLSLAEFGDLRTAATGFDRLAAMWSASMTIGDADRAPDRVQGAFVSAEAFAVLREAPIMGRAFRAEDDTPGAAAVGLVSHGLWQARYGGDAGVVGRTVTVDGRTVAVVGVMPKDFRFPGTADLWLPLAAMPGIAALPREARRLTVFGRLTDGVTTAAADAEVAALRAAWTAQFPERDRRISTTVRPINEQFNPSATDPTWIAFITAGALVLLIACANVANLLLMRGLSRAREMAVRASIGGTRVRIVRQLLTEGLVLAVAAAAVGVGLSHLGLRTLAALLPADALPYWMTFSLDLRVVGVLAAVTLGSVLVFALAPAIHLSRADPALVLHESGRGHTGGVGTRRWMATFLAVECALTLVLLAAVAVSARQDLAAARGEFRVDGRPLLTMWISLPEQAYGSADARRAFLARLSERLGGLPGGVQTAFASSLPGGGGAPQPIAIVDRPETPGQPAPTALTIAVDRGYFAVTQVPLRGNGFGPAEGNGASDTAIVNERFARLFLPDRSPLGARIQVGAPAEARTLTIVGVVPTVRQRGGPDPDPVVYRPLGDAAPATFAIVARGDGGAAAADLGAPIRDVLREIDPGLAAYRLMTLERAMHDARWNGRLSNVLLRSIAAIGAVLSLLGLYAVTGHAVRQRRRELGVLAALGARPRQLQWLVLRPAIRPLAVGLALGVGCVHAFERLVGVGGAPIAMSDAATLLPLLGVVLVVAVTACLMPAHRAARVDPAEALRLD